MDGSGLALLLTKPADDALTAEAGISDGDIERPCQGVVSRVSQRAWLARIDAISAKGAFATGEGDLGKSARPLLDDVFGTSRDAVAATRARLYEGVLGERPWRPDGGRCGAKPPSQQ